MLPSVVDLLEAIKPGAPVVRPEAPDNIVAAIPSAMEPRSTIAEIEKKTGWLLLHVRSQTPCSTRDLLAEQVLKRPKESVRALVGDIGGGFGQKTSLYPEDDLVAYAATKLGKKIGASF